MQGDILDSKSRNLKAIIDEYFMKSEDDLPNHNQICQVFEKNKLALILFRFSGTFFDSFCLVLMS